MAKKDKYDVKKKPNGKWTVVDENGKQYHNAGELDTEKEAVKRLREIAGHEAHSKEPKGYRHKKKSELVRVLQVAADKLDQEGFRKEADELDNILKTLKK
jgi:soluble cytochrome b562